MCYKYGMHGKPGYDVPGHDVPLLPVLDTYWIFLCKCVHKLLVPIKTSLHFPLFLESMDHLSHFSFRSPSF